MPKERIQWEDMPDHFIENWLSEYQLEQWPFASGEKHGLNRDKVEKIYTSIFECNIADPNEECPEPGTPIKKKLPKEPNLKILYDLLRKIECAVFDDERLIQIINNKGTSDSRTCEIGVRNINRFIKSL